ncbi:MAG: hypothetical protein LBI59_07405, partial [Candidatus Accumulibacter sp.]|nr:hypothetical protein [Accumulibacter sp.]
MKKTKLMSRNERRRRRLILLGLLSGSTVGACAYLQHPKFGAPPGDEAMNAFRNSPNLLDDRFQNLLPTPLLSEDSGFVSTLLSSLAGGERLRPEAPIPVRKTDLKALDR